jgi:acyl phosphate:glycerol-3-phosphate acyltransferase
VFVFDFLKGAVPVALTWHFLPDVPWAAVAAGLAAFVGHMFPVYLRFRGGKGVATGTGVVAVLLPGPTVVAALIWVAALATWRYVSLASVLAAMTLAVVRLVATPEPFAADEATLTGFSLLAAALVVVRHRSNLLRLFRGIENRVTDSPRLQMISRVLHIFAVSVWFGAGVFFTFFVALSLFHTFEGLDGKQPDWLHLTSPLTKEQGTRLAGIAVAPLFPRYFEIQAVCAMVAQITAWRWARVYPERVHRIRFALIAGAVVLLLVGWPLIGKIEALRFARYSGDDAARAAANSAFLLWHTVSLCLNFAVLFLVGWATALLARLPADPPVAAPPQAG